MTLMHLQQLEAESFRVFPLSNWTELDTVTEIIQEMLLARTSERQRRVLDHDATASMEKKKQEGYC